MSHAIERPTDITVPPTSLWAKMPMIAGVVGVAGTGFTIAMMFGDHKDRAFFAYLFAFAFTLSIALGALAFVLIQHATRAGWSAVVRRIAETAMATLPLFAVLFIPIAVLGFHTLYPWSHETDKFLEAKRWWLGAELGNGSGNKFYMRAVIFFGIWTLLSQLLYRWSLAQDNLGDNKTERDAITRKLWTLSAGGIFLFALSQSFAAIDWLMSLQPHWYSTMFGVYFFAGSMVGFYAFLAVVTMSLQKYGMITKAVTTEHYHDIGKFAFGHTVFWGYIAFCQFMLIWYANIPEETEYYMMRMAGGWDKISLAIPFVVFFIPFFLTLSRHVKRSRVGLLIAGIYLLFAHALDLYWAVIPNAGAHGEKAPGTEHAVVEAGAAGSGELATAVHHGAHFGIALVDVAAFVGIVGLFLALFSFLLQRNKVICIGDPRLDESLKHENY
ncbi:MAG: quinol:cytochrome C oxidoreductase [Deltaproteobacteria bacterium]|nr:quinol:cytochrome C oxidoreductase [Deltaproteobacteria bacterium]